jgi:hypothetical protein
MVAFMLMFPPLAYNLWAGMQQVILLLILVAMLIELRRREDSIAGLCLAAAILLRAYPLGLLGYLATLRRWKALSFSVLGVALGAILTVFSTGWPVCRSWIVLTGLLHPTDAPMGQPALIVNFPGNLNLAAFVRWLYNPSGDAAVSPVVACFALLIEIGLVALTIKASAVHMRGDDPDWRGYGLWIVTVSWISPLAWIQFMCCFVPLMVGLGAAWERDRNRSRRAVYAMVASYILLTIVPPIGHPLHPILAHLITASFKSGGGVSAPTYQGAAAAVGSSLAVVPFPNAILRRRNLHWMLGARFVAMALAWLSAWWFLKDWDLNKHSSIVSATQV